MAQGIWQDELLLRQWVDSLTVRESAVYMERIISGLGWHCDPQKALYDLLAERRNEEIKAKIAGDIEHWRTLHHDE